MSYTNSLDNPELYFQTKLYTGNRTDDHAITLDGSENMQPDFVWIKSRSSSHSHNLYDVIRGVNKPLRSNGTNTEFTRTDALKSFDSDGFTLDDDATSDEVNNNGVTYASWNWKAGGSAPAITYSVKVVSDSGNKYRFDDFGTSAVTLDLQEGGTYTFDQSDSSNSGHPLRFSTTSNGSHGGGSEYTTGVTVTGTPGNAGAKTVITVGSGVATLYYYCTQHSAMGGQANTNSTFGSSNFSGSIQSTVSANTTAGFSIVSYTGTGSNATVGHGLGVAPGFILIKARSVGNTWGVYYGDNTDVLFLDETSASSDSATYWNDTSPTSSVFTVNTNTKVNQSSATYIAYCFAEKKGYSKFGSYTGNGNADGTFVYTGFKPAWLMIKRTDASGHYWHVYDNKREPFNPVGKVLYPNRTDAEYAGSNRPDLLSNGFKNRSGNTDINASGGSYIYMAFAESPFTNSNGVPNNAR